MAEAGGVPQTPRAAAAARKLVEAGVSLSEVHALVTRNECTAVHDLLAANRASVYAADAGGWRMLHVAARSDAVEMADMLLVRAAAPLERGACCRAQRQCG
jgi:hypothetical protein